MNNPFYGKKHTKVTRDKISRSKTGLYSGTDNPFYGKEHTEDTKRNIGKKNKVSSSKQWKVICPDKSIKIIINLKQFCKINKLNYSSMFRVAIGNQLHHKGYKCEKDNLKKVLSK